MKRFSCPNCEALLYFDSESCMSCGEAVLYDPDSSSMQLESAPGIHACANASPELANCNWSAAKEGSLCRACALNQTIPDLSVDGNIRRWSQIEAAKRRMVYSLLALGLKVGPKAHPGDADGIAFDFLADPPGDDAGQRVLTGHDSGLITLNVAEADSEEREKFRLQMGEPYRTLVGHFRHEIGHYYWDQLIRDEAPLAGYRALFGDERADYGKALEKNYRDGPPKDWRDRFISTYAASHPWEDWAESWAHYLHITDTLETASAYAVAPDIAEGDRQAGGNQTPIVLSEIGRFSMDELAKRWRPLVIAVNALNRSMGVPDLYPFVLNDHVVTKLGFVHDLINGR